MTQVDRLSPRAAPAALRLLLAASIAAGCGQGGGARGPADDTGRTDSPAGGTTVTELVDVTTLDPSILADIRYAGPDNFVGEPVDGYEAQKCLLSRPAAAALAAVQEQLAERGYGLLVFDCYRPQRAVDHFVRWARDTADRRTKETYYPAVPKSDLFADGYIAERSGHSRGSTVDLTLVEIHSDGTAVARDMGTPFDFFDPSSSTDSPDVTPRQRADRSLLREYMEAGGFRNYEAEWWHYTLIDEPWPERYLDVVIR